MLRERGHLLTPLSESTTEFVTLLTSIGAFMRLSAPKMVP